MLCDASNGILLFMSQYISSASSALGLCRIYRSVFLNIDLVTQIGLILSSGLGFSVFFAIIVCERFGSKQPMSSPVLLNAK